jgi:hypothetical protein
MMGYDAVVMFEAVMPGYKDKNMVNASSKSKIVRRNLLLYSTAEILTWLKMGLP